VPGLIINGCEVPVPGLDIVNWHDDHSLRLGSTDLRQRKPDEQWVRSIVLHSTLGIPGGSDNRPQVVKPGFGPGGDRAERLIRYWTQEQRGAGAHLIVDFDGQISCCADLQTEATYHAGHANGVSVGVEVVQGRKEAEFYLAQLETVVALVDAITALMPTPIQRMIPAGPYAGPIHRLTESMDDVVGIVGHRDLTNRRGKGDPGSKIFFLLGHAGYEPVSYELGQDRDLWRLRQRSLGIAHPDGIAGPQTCRAIKQALSIPGVKGRRPNGLWVTRPMDSLLTT
jgi:hypothetical protein